MRVERRTVLGRDGLGVVRAVGMGGLAVLVGLLFVGRKSFWFDEAYDVVLARSSWRHLLEVGVNHEASQFAYLLVLKPWLGVAGESEWTARLPSVLFFACAAVVYSSLVARIYGPRVAVIAGALLVVNGYVVALAQQARTYSFALLLTIVSTSLLVSALEDERVSRWLLYGLVAAVSVYAHFMAAGVVAAHAATAASYRPVPDRRRASVAGAIVGCAAAPAVWFAVARDSGQIDWLPPFSVSAVRGVLTEAVDRDPALLVASVVGVAVILRARDLRVWQRVLPIAWLGLPVLLLLGVSTLKSLLWSRYLIVAAPGLALCAAIGLSRIRAPMLTVAAATCVLLVGMFRVAGWYSSGSLEDWRAADRLVAERAGSSGAVTVQPPERAQGWLVYERLPLRPLRRGRPIWLIAGSAAEVDALRARIRDQLCSERALPGLVIAQLRPRC